MMYTVKSLLDRDDFEGVGKEEAENYIAAMERLGYKPEHDPDYSYEAQVRDLLENNLGLQRKEQEPNHISYNPNNLDNSVEKPSMLK